MKRFLLLSVFCGLLFSAAAWSQSVSLQGLFKGGAIFTINGKQRLLRVGKTSPEGITLVAADDASATIELNGQQQRLTMSSSVSSGYSAAEKSVARIQSGPGGHYSTPGRINNKPVNFLVDTGATTVAMNLPTAQYLGINYRRGREIKVSTANGIASAYLVMLDSVTVGTVTVNNVEATVSVGDFPQEILLGNSYLSRVEMRQESGVLVLESQL